MTYMRYEDVAKWKDTFNTDTVDKERGADYEAFKKEKAELLLNVVSKKFPGLRGCIRSCYVATPLTYRDYQGTGDGSMYGIAKTITIQIRRLFQPVRGCRINSSRAKTLTCMAYWVLLSAH